MTHDIMVEPLTAEAFSEFGDVIEAVGPATRIINGGRCERFSDLARLDFGDTGRPAISVFSSAPVTLPLVVTMLERHPEGSQAFIPMSADPFLVVVAPDEDGVPGRPRAFVTAPGQGVNYLRDGWHGVLSPLVRPALFAVVDRIGPGLDVEEHHFATPYRVVEG
ncbi:MAG: ureidoglycolate lyase [Hyphomicrobiaceae bacterium]